MSELLFRYREPFSAACSAIVSLAALLFINSLTPTVRYPVTNSAPIELTFSVSEAQSPTEQRVAQPLPQATPAIRYKLSHAAVPSKESIAVDNTPVAPVDPASRVHVEAVVPDSATPPAQSIPALPDLVIPSVASSAIQQDFGRNAEAIYVGKVRSYLQAIKRYPTGREASLQRPSGTSVVWFMVRRRGELVEAGIETSSGSMLLDNAALATVRRSSYPVFPDEAWVGKTQQRFTVELDFIPAP